MDRVYSLSDLHSAEASATHIEDGGVVVAHLHTTASRMDSFIQLLVQLMTEVGFQVTSESDRDDFPDEPRPRHFTSLDGHECNCQLVVTRCNPVLLVQGSFSPTKDATLEATTFTTTDLRPSNYVLQPEDNVIRARYVHLDELSMHFKNRVALPLAHHVRNAFGRPDGPGSISLLGPDVHHILVRRYFSEEERRQLRRLSSYWDHI